ncbi:hypothetical protein CAter282_4335 [Collimonas arenae]|uniref:Uncharacterized protein n=1 Tax=Collimonas arenae TaxID=279058 RepID=A0A127QQC9_9BURK|nr:hypothetical protein CAter282_4335 [Collimonas arenae]
MAFRCYSDFDDMIEHSHWNQKRIVFPESRIHIHVPHGLMAKDIPFPSRVELTTNDGRPFTSGELFYKIHKALVEPAANPSRLLHGAKLTAHPNQWPNDGKPYLYGFYTKDKWSMNYPY